MSAEHQKIGKMSRGIIGRENIRGEMSRENAGFHKVHPCDSVRHCPILHFQSIQFSYL